ncbi:MAG: hypothetical protein JWN89_173 [Parcubacteria group bacterium]|nr:hypothetical protein [Parcubacteria group bacterium]
MKWKGYYRIRAQGQEYGSNIVHLGGGGPIDVEAETYDEAETNARLKMASTWEDRYTEDDFQIMKLEPVTRIKHE